MALHCKQIIITALHVCAILSCVSLTSTISDTLRGCLLWHPYMCFDKRSARPIKACHQVSHGDAFPDICFMCQYVCRKRLQT